MHGLAVRNPISNTRPCLHPIGQVAGWLGSQSLAYRRCRRAGGWARSVADPGGDVGIETLLIRSRDVTYQVPLEYRNAPLQQAGDCLIGTLEHSVLGTRWVYDAVGDSVYIDEVLRVSMSSTPKRTCRLARDRRLPGTGMETTRGTSPTAVHYSAPSIVRGCADTTLSPAPVWFVDRGR